MEPFIVQNFKNQGFLEFAETCNEEGCKEVTFAHLNRLEGGLWRTVTPPNDTPKACIVFGCWCVSVNQFPCSQATVPHVPHFESPSQQHYIHVSFEDLWNNFVQNW